MLRNVSYGGCAAHLLKVLCRPVRALPPQLPASHINWTAIVHIQVDFALKNSAKPASQPLTDPLSSGCVYVAWCLVCFVRLLGRSASWIFCNGGDAYVQQDITVMNTCGRPRLMKSNLTSEAWLSIIITCYMQATCVSASCMS